MNDYNSELVEKAVIRQAQLSDAFDIYNLIKGNANELIVRPIGDIVRNIDRFSVAYLDGKIASCASFTIWPEPGEFSRSMVELTSVVVRSDLRGKGIGIKLVRGLIERVSVFRPSMLIVLTFTPPFFAKLGFVEIPKTEILHKIYSGCINCTKHVNPFTCPEVAMILRLPDGDGKNNNQ